MHFFQFQNESDIGWQWILEFRRVGENVRLRSGYASQTDWQRTYLEAGYAWRFRKGALRRWSVVPMAELVHDTSGNAVGRRFGMGSWLFFFNQMRLEFHTATGSSQYQTYGDDDRLRWNGSTIPTRELGAELAWEQCACLLNAFNTALTRLLSNRPSKTAPISIDRSPVQPEEIDIIGFHGKVVYPLFHRFADLLLLFICQLRMVKR